METLRRSLLGWFERHGRRDLPWQNPRTPYRVWISEVMLQQTQVETALPYFERFLDRFPDLLELAGASIEEVLALWQGLGYYRRAHLLHRAARILAREGFPETVAGWQRLPGIGRSTAGAIVSLAFDRPAPILDGNVKRLWCRLFGIEGWPGDPSVEKRLWQISEATLPSSRGADWTQALMDLGALICRPKAPLCGSCPVRELCAAHLQGRTEQLPEPRPNRKRPEREVVWLVLRNRRGEVYLERRADFGLWAGLWTLPEFPSLEEAKRSFPIERGRPLAEGRHAFTHFRLRFRPLLVEVEEVPVVREGEAGWFRLDRLPPLPKPVQRLLAALSQR